MVLCWFALAFCAAGVAGACGAWGIVLHVDRVRADQRQTAAVEVFGTPCLVSVGSKVGDDGQLTVRYQTVIATQVANVSVVYLDSPEFSYSEAGGLCAPPARTFWTLDGVASTELGQLADADRVDGSMLATWCFVGCFVGWVVCACAFWWYSKSC